MRTSSAHTHIEPTSADILCGKDKTLNNRPGNLRFRDEIRAHFPTYFHESTSKVDKMIITKQIVQKMKDEYGSRFLAESSEGIYYEISDAKARDKVSHALRTARKASTRNNIQIPYSHRIRKHSVESGSNKSTDASTEQESDRTDESRDTSVPEGRESAEDREPAVIEQDSTDIIDLLVCQRQYLQQFMKDENFTTITQPTLNNVLLTSRNITNSCVANFDSLDFLKGSSNLFSLDGIDSDFDF